MQDVVRWVKVRTANRDASRGQLLIEVLIGLAILGMISVVFIGAMYTSLHAARITDERSNALTLAKSQIEFVKARPYSDNDWAYTVDVNGATPASVALKPSWWGSNPPPKLSDEFGGYEVAVSGTSDIDLDGLENAYDGIRTITATVRHHDDEVITLQNYEVDR